MKNSKDSKDTKDKKPLSLVSLRSLVSFSYAESRSQSPSGASTAIDRPPSEPT